MSGYCLYVAGKLSRTTYSKGMYAAGRPASIINHYFVYSFEYEYFTTDMWFPYYATILPFYTEVRALSLYTRLPRQEF